MAYLIEHIYMPADPTATVDVLQDLEYFKNKLFESLKIPNNLIEKNTITKFQFMQGIQNELQCC